MTTTIDSELESQLSWLQQEVDQLPPEHDRVKDRLAPIHTADLVTIALFLYDRTQLWNERHIADPTMEKEAESLFRRWYDAAKHIYSIVRDAAPADVPPNLLERFRDAIGFCPYIAVTAEELRNAEREYDEGR